MSVNDKSRANAEAALLALRANARSSEEARRALEAMRAPRGMGLGPK